MTSSAESDSAVSREGGDIPSSIPPWAKAHGFLEIAMTKIFLVRHGEAENPKNVIYGRLPGFGLSAKGREEAKMAGEYLRLHSLARSIYTSSMLRTRQTAQIIHRNIVGSKVTLAEEIIETDLGEWVGKTEEELVKAGVWQVFINHPSRVTVGEGIPSVQKRIVAWIERLVKSKQGQEYIVVSHREPIRLLTLFLEKRQMDDLNQVPCETGSITTVIVDQEMNLFKPIEYWEPDMGEPL